MLYLILVFHWRIFTKNLDLIELEKFFSPKTDYLSVNLESLRYSTYVY